MARSNNFEILVRASRPEDWEAFAVMREEPAVRYNTLAIPFADPIRSRERFSTSREDERRLIAEAIFEDGSRRLAGQLGLHLEYGNRAHCAGFGIQVATEFQGRGVGTALMSAMCDLADNWLNLHRLELEVFSDNEAGMALYRKFGFEVESTMIRYAFRDGGYVDAYKMGRINPRHQGALR